MCKNTKKRNNYNGFILHELKIRYGYSLDYIRKSLRGDRMGIVPDKIIKEYKLMEFAANSAIEEKLKQIASTKSR